jgi:hypothetical protein
MLEGFIALVALASGCAAKAILDASVDKKKSMELDAWKLRVETLEKRLSEFYWPLYLRLQRDNVVWERILEREHPDSKNRKLARTIEESVILPNHREAIAIIERGIHLAALDPEFEAELLKYVRHVAVYTSARAAGIWDLDPIAFDEPWPHDFFPLVQQRLSRYQSEMLTLLREQGVG